MKEREQKRLSRRGKAPQNVRFRVRIGRRRRKQSKHSATPPRGDSPWFLAFGVFRGSLFSAPRTPQIRNPYRAGTAPGFLSISFLTTEQMEHTKSNPCAVIPSFRVFGVFRGSLFSAARTPNRPVTLIARGLSPVSCQDVIYSPFRPIQACQIRFLVIL